MGSKKKNYTARARTNDQPNPLRFSIQAFLEENGSPKSVGSTFPASRKYHGNQFFIFFLNFTVYLWRNTQWKSINVQNQTRKILQENVHVKSSCRNTV